MWLRGPGLCIIRESLSRYFEAAHQLKAFQQEGAASKGVSLRYIAPFHHGPQDEKAALAFFTSQLAGGQSWMTP